MKKGKASLGLQWLTTGVSTTLVLVLLGMVIFFLLFAQRLSDSVKEDLTVTVLISDAATPQDINTFRKKLSTEYFVKHLHYISKEDALKEQIKAMGSDPSEFLGANPFTASVELHMQPAYSNTDSLVWISSYLKQQSCVEDVIYQKELVDSINQNLRNLSYIFLALAALLTLVSFALINNTVRLSLHSGRFLIRTMKLVGATRGFIRRPFMNRSFWLGLISGVLANAILLAGIRTMLHYDATVGQYIDEQMLIPVGAAVLLFGLLLTLLCTYFSVNKYLRLKANDVY